MARKQHYPDQCLADILTNIDSARGFIGEMTREKLHDDDKTLQAVLKRLENASEAYSRLCDSKHGAPEVAKAIEARHPGVPWRHFQSLANVYRHDYDLIDVDLVWKVLQPGGAATLVEAVIRQELPLSEIPPKA
jgi:uncharacterized protein with HEPN domain